MNGIALKPVSSSTAFSISSCRWLIVSVSLLFGAVSGDLFLCCPQRIRWSRLLLFLRRLLPKLVLVLVLVLMLAPKSAASLVVASAWPLSLSLCA